MASKLKSLFDISLSPQPGDECALQGGHVRLVINGVSPETILFELRQNHSASSHSCKRMRLMASIKSMGIPTT